MTIYTHNGDKGRTSLITGESVEKDDPQIVFYGLLDELSSYIGWLIASFPKEWKEKESEEKRLLRHAQQLLFRLPIGLLKDRDTSEIYPSEEDLIALEKYIDDTDKELNGLFKGFILPGGGHPLAAQTHVVRCVCRRIEREVYTLTKQSESIAQLMQKGGSKPYLNRLSDFLYAMAQRIEYVAKRLER